MKAIELNINHPHLNIQVFNTETLEPNFENELTISPSEQQFLNLIKVDKRKKEWLACRYFLKHMLGNKASLAYLPNGKPYLAEQPNMHISLSHSDKMVAIAANNKQSTGLDIQHYSHKILKIKSKFSNSTDIKHAENSADTDMYYHLLWGYKEAIFKVFGEHLLFKDDITLAKIDTTKNNKTCATVRHGHKTYQFNLAHIMGKHYYLTYVISFSST